MASFIIEYAKQSTLGALINFTIKKCISPTYDKTFNADLHRYERKNKVWKQQWKHSLRIIQISEILIRFDFIVMVRELLKVVEKASSKWFVVAGFLWEQRTQRCLTHRPFPFHRSEVLWVRRGGIFQREKKIVLLYY